MTREQVKNQQGCYMLGSVNPPVVILLKLLRWWARGQIAPPDIELFRDLLRLFLGHHIPLYGVGVYY